MYTWNIQTTLFEEMMKEKKASALFIALTFARGQWRTNYDQNT